MQRRTFLKSGLLSLATISNLQGGVATAQVRKPPNILWISAEDISPDLGCYGDTYADTPNIDAFAKTAVRYDRAYSHSGVCAPSRSGIITGMYPTTIGTHHMRCSGIPPAEVKCFPEYLRAAGYFCTNNRKTDYQFDAPLSAWDENGNKAHWRNRAADQPFFSVFNLTVCHESQVRSDDPERLQQIENLGPRKHDPAKAPVPPYHADTPATRKDWAQYYDIVSIMDGQMGEVMAQLEADGLADDTIVWFWGDHGRGLTRGKRWLYESGTRIPLLIHVPEKYRDWARPGAADTLASGARDDLVCFLDFAPTMLSLAGVPLPAHFQGQAFLGPDEAEPRQYVYGARDRMDEAYDLIRTVRDKRFRYFRNYMPYVTYAQHIQYMDQMPMLQDLRRLHDEGKLNADQAKWFAPRKPLEELYDVEADPHELNNLAGNPAYQADLARLRQAHLDWMTQTKDVGLIPEPLFDHMKWPEGQSPDCAPAHIREEQGKLALHCETPGASINYRWDDDPEGRWQLYKAPLESRQGIALTAKANRIGFRDSAETSSDTKHPAGGAQPQAHEQPAFPSPETLEKLLALRMHDDRAAERSEIYLDALEADEPAMRYWAIVSLHRLVGAAHFDEAWKDRVRPKLADPSPTVRVAAAHAMTAWGEGTEGIPALAAVLTEGSQGERLFAAVALADCGDAARPAVDALRQARDDKWSYVSWVAIEALRQLGESPG